MTPELKKCRTDNEPASSPPPKRSRSMKTTRLQQTSPQTTPPRQRSPSLEIEEFSNIVVKPYVPPSSTKAAPDPETDLDSDPETDLEIDPETDPETDPEPDPLLLDRIQAGITYTNSRQRPNLPPAQTTRFHISTTSPSSRSALALLRTHATLISSSPSSEVHELGIPRPDPVREGVFPGVHDAQWWIGKSAAEIKAGPLADEHDIKKAGVTLKGLETKRAKKGGRMTGREREVAGKLEEGVRRQERGLGMWDEDEI